jgi:hypothetical protein
LAALFAAIQEKFCPSPPKMLSLPHIRVASVPIPSNVSAAEFLKKISSYRHQQKNGDFFFAKRFKKSF